ncbi:TPA: AlkZ family DNA glycosylase [Corynebacterium aurimucosum]|nr:AlkZ family DNA glycosylase [Corynebacterium aurimucosum]
MKELNRDELLARRLIAQGLAPSAARPSLASALDVAEHLLALQGQTYDAGIRALALRAGCDEQKVLEDIARFRVVRCWPQRGTLHFMPAADVRWMSRLLYPRVASSQKSRRPSLGLSENMVAAASEALHGAATEPLTRAEVYEIFAEVGVDPTEGRGSHLLRAFGGAGDLVQGPKAGSQETFLHVDALPTVQREPEEPLYELAQRYVEGHGPISVADLQTWSKLSKSQAAKALASTEATTVNHDGQRLWMAGWQEDVTASEIDGALKIRLELPAFDEYLLGYANKDWIVPDEIRVNVLTRNGLSWPWVMEGGRGVASLRHP